MSKVYNTAQGKRIDIDSIRLTNEDVIAVGNMKVNARGDQLGPGGRVLKTKDQVMKEYYTLNTPVAADAITPQAAVADVVAAPVKEEIILDAASGLDESDMGEPLVIPEAPAMIQGPGKGVPLVDSAPQPTELRGSLASTLSQAAPATVTQKELLPPKKANGVQRF